MVSGSRRGRLAPGHVACHGSYHVACLMPVTGSDTPAFNRRTLVFKPWYGSSCPRPRDIVAARDHSRHPEAQPASGPEGGRGAGLGFRAKGGRRETGAPRQWQVKAIVPLLMEIV